MDNEPSSIGNGSSIEDIANMFSEAEMPTFAVFDPETVQGVDGVAVVRSMEAEEESGKATESAKPGRLERIMRPASLATNGVVEGAMTEISRAARSSRSRRVAPGT